MKPIALLPLLLLAACDQHAAASHQATAADGNSMRCDAGDIKLAGAGVPEVEIGGFGIQGDMLNGFALNLTVERGGKVHQVSSSLMPLPMQAGSYQFPSMAFYKVRTADRDLLRDYNGGTYVQQYSPVEDDPEAKLKIQVDKMAVSDGAQPGFKRIHAVGHFAFNAAALPAASPSDACVSNGVARSLESVKAGKRLLPLYDAATCGAEKKHIECDFDITTELLKQG